MSISGLTATARSGVAAIFTAFASIVETVTYRENSSATAPTYNTTTGAVTVNDGTPVSVDVICVSYREDRFKSEFIRPEDQKMLIPATDLTPVTGARVTRTKTGFSGVWEIVSCKVDPAGALWLCQIRKAV